jgi:hypothetical protein
VPKALFPSRRFRGIGISREVVEELKASFDRSDRIVQQDTVDHLKSLSSAGLRQYAEAWQARLAEKASPEVQEDEPLTEAPGGLSGASGESEDLTDVGGLLGEDPSSSEA